MWHPGGKIAYQVPCSVAVLGVNVGDNFVWQFGYSFLSIFSRSIFVNDFNTNTPIIKKGYEEK